MKITKKRKEYRTEYYCDDFVNIYFLNCRSQNNFVIIATKANLQKEIIDQILYPYNGTKVLFTKYNHKQCILQFINLNKEILTEIDLLITKYLKLKSFL